MPRRPIEQTQSQGNLIRAPSRTGSAAACSGQAWIAARRPRPAVGVVSLCNRARRRGGSARLTASRAHRSRRKNSAVCSSCGRQKARMGTLLPADATRDKRSMLITQVAALEGWCRCQSLGIWRQTPCKDLLGRQPGHAAELQRRTRSLVLPDSQLTYKKRPMRPKETTDASGTPRRRPTCASRACGSDGACKTAALGDALHVMIGNIHDRVRTLRGRVPNSLESTTARRPSAFRSALCPPLLGK